MSVNSDSVIQHLHDTNHSRAQTHAQGEAQSVVAIRIHLC